MQWFPPYKVPPIPRRYYVPGLIIIVLFVWTQGAANRDIIHLIFLTSNYTLWALLLPWLYGWVQSWKTTPRFYLLMQGIIITSVQWILSNVLFYFLRFIVTGAPLVPSLSEVESFLLVSILNRIFDCIVLSIALISAHRGILLNKEKIHAALQAQELQKEKLKALKNQLNPHFLFNTLNNITTLIAINPEKAEQMTHQMSLLLRKMLRMNEQDDQTLGEEWEFSRMYLSVEEERFQDRLQLTTEIDQAILSQKVPTMLLQPLIENAIKHGVEPSVEPCHVRISIQRDEADKLLVMVENTVSSQPSKLAESTGVGLKNLHQRLEVYYNGDVFFESERTHARFSVVIKLPLKEG